MSTPRDAGTSRWDLLVIGGGTAGILGARTAASLGARVALVERDRLGGDCLWTGCVPSKALLAAANAAAAARTASRFGVDVDSVRVDFTRVRQHIQSAIADIARGDSAEVLGAAGVTVVRGDARFIDAHRVEVDGQPISFRQALIATGAAPAVPPTPGQEHTAYLTSETIWELESLPLQLTILGGGSVGCELGQAFARLGTAVTVVEGARRILPREDGFAAHLVAASLRENGVTLHSGHAAVTVEPEPDGSGCLVLDDGRRVPFGRLLVAVGRAPRTGSLGLAAARGADRRAGVRPSGPTPAHNEPAHLGGRRPHRASPVHPHRRVHANLAATNAVLGVRRTVDTTSVPRVTFTDPEVAAVGVPTDPLPVGLRVLEWTNDRVDRAVTEGNTAGVSRLAVDASGHILGATLVGPRAGESLSELSLAIRHGLRARDLAGTTHPYPTFSDGPWHAAIGEVLDRLARPRTAAVLSRLARARGWWLDRRMVTGPAVTRPGARQESPDRLTGFPFRP